MSQAATLKLSGRFADTLYKHGMIATAVSGVAAFAYYVGFYRRRNNAFREHAKLATTDEEIERITGRLAKFGVIPGPNTIVTDGKVLQGLKEDNDATAKPKLNILNTLVADLPPSEKSSAKKAREEFLRKNLPISTALALDMKEDTKNMTTVQKSEYFKSKRILGRMEDALDEVKAADTAKLNKQLSQILAKA